jgi:hypothetical protein
LSDYDRGADPGADIRFVGGPEAQTPSTKQHFIQAYMDRWRMKYDDVLFIDDTMSEVLSLKGICRTLHVPTKGMNPQMIADICQLVAVPESQNQQRSVQQGESARADVHGGFWDLISAMQNVEFAPRARTSTEASVGILNRGDPAVTACKDDRCQVWSKSNNAWCRGVVMGQDGPMIRVEFTTVDGNVFSKSLPVGCEDLRIEKAVTREAPLGPGSSVNHAHWSSQPLSRQASGNGGVRLVEANSDDEGKSCFLNHTKDRDNRRVREGGPCCTQ